ncbi:MAG: cell wall metabolism sensor histidine kinase WalK [Candidatus Omnitrophica bacterium]|nr:cell wall metabolism sensor histidine kinase WalK [Candidatus Omnitrophota bacterium]
MAQEFQRWQVPKLVDVVMKKDSHEKKDVLKLMKDFSATLRKIPLYPSTHPMVKESVTALYAGLTDFFQHFGDLSLDVMEDHFMLCGHRLEDPAGMSKDLLTDLKRLHVEGVFFKSSLKEDELEKFLRILTLKQDIVEAKGGIKKMLLEEQIDSIHMLQVKYARISDEQQVADKKSEPPPPPQIVTPPEEKAKDPVGMLSDFFGGTADQIPEKEMIEMEFKKHARTVVKQLLKLIGPEKAIEEIISSISERLKEAGFSDEEAAPYLEKIREEVIRMRQPKAGKKDLERQVKILAEENEELKEKLANVQVIVEEQVKERTVVLEQENKKIKRERQQVNAVLKNVAEGLVIVDKQGKVLLLNPAAEKLLGVNKEQKIGSNILDGLTEGQMVSYTKDKQQQVEIELAGPSEATKRTLRASSAVIESEDGQPIGMVSVLSDVTKQKEVQRMKDTFVSSVSHELRAPLISIQKSLSLFLEMGNVQMTGDQKRFLEIASNNAQRLSQLVNDLLDVSKLEAGRMKPEFAAANLRSVAREVIEMLQVWGSSRGITLIEQVPDALELDIDKKMMNQVITNLVGNAIKFTPSGGSVTIAAAVSGDKAEISITDTGCGIPADSLERIFEKFEQAKTVPVEGAPKGTGLGLSIVKEIVKLHGGTIWVESELGKGSRFIFRIPLRQETAAAGE